MAPRYSWISEKKRKIVRELWPLRLSSSDYEPRIRDGDHPDPPTRSANVTTNHLISGQVPIITFLPVHSIAVYLRSTSRCAWKQSASQIFLIIHWSRCKNQEYESYVKTFAEI